MSKNIVLKKGLDLPLKGEAELRISKNVSPDIVALEPGCLKGFTPRLLVKEGDKVLCGSPVMADKKNPDILLASPASGTVKEISRGEKRKLLAVLIQADGKQESLDFGIKSPEGMEADEVKAALLESGLWPFLIQRPYGIVANPATSPKAIFISAFSTAPLAASGEFTLGDRTGDLQKGIDALAKLTTGGVHLSLDAKDCENTPFAKLKNVSFHIFEGKHPAGNVGVQISHIAPIAKGELVWTVSMEGLAAIGRRFASGKYDLRRKVAVTGPAAIEPSYAEALPGTPMKTFGAFYGGDSEGIRLVSGDILSGRTVGEGGYLGFYDNQVTIVSEGYEPELLGWLNPLRLKLYSHDHSYFSWLTPWRKYEMDTNLHGGPRAFVMGDSYYGKVLPMDIYPLYLTKACLAGDIDKMEKFGIYEVIPEDLAVCEYVDPSKNNIQDIVAKGIDLMLKEMA